MSGKNYAKLELKSYPQKKQRETPEGRYWKKFRNPINHQQNGPVTCIHFSPVAPYDIAVTASARVQIYNSATLEVRHALSRFKDIAYSARYRKDGKLMVVGGEFPVVRVFESSGRTLLRQFKAHKQAVRLTTWAPDGLSVISGSDDKTVRVWDVTTGLSTRRFTDHTDYVRCAATTATSTDTFISGSYDHTIKGWDTRTKGGCSFSFNHGDPIEAVVMIPGGGVCLSAGGNTIKAWDLLGGKLMHSFSNHQKAITTLSLDSTGSRIISASLDGLVKIYDVATYKVVHGMKYNTPLLSVAVSPENKLLVAGTSDGTLCTRKREIKLEERMGHTTKTLIRTGSASYYNRGKSGAAPTSSLIVETGKKQKLKPYDLALKAFKYQEALDLALATRQPVIVISMLEELGHRQAISMALSGRTEATLEPVLKFLGKYLCVPNYTPVLMEVCGVIIDMYTKVIGQSITVDELFKKLETAIRKEVTLQQKLLRMVGALDTIMAASVLAEGQGTDAGGMKIAD